MADIPKSIERLVEKDRVYFYGLLILLDGKAYWECTAGTAKGLEQTMRAWKSHTWPSLKRSDVRYFVKSPGDIKEITIPSTSR
jgi:hypothetical protein